MPHVFHKLCVWLSLTFACMLPGAVMKTGTVDRDDIHLISDSTDEDGNVVPHFELNTQCQGALHAMMQTDGDEIAVPSTRNQ